MFTDRKEVRGYGRAEMQLPKMRRKRRLCVIAFHLPKKGLQSLWSVAPASIACFMNDVTILVSDVKSARQVFVFAGMFVPLSSSLLLVCYRGCGDLTDGSLFNTVTCQELE